MRQRERGEASTQRKDATIHCPTALASFLPFSLHVKPDVRTATPTAATAGVLERCKKDVRSMQASAVSVVVADAATSLTACLSRWRESKTSWTEPRVTISHSAVNIVGREKERHLHPLKDPKSKYRHSSHLLAFVCVDSCGSHERRRRRRTSVTTSSSFLAYLLCMHSTHKHKCTHGHSNSLAKHTETERGYERGICKLAGGTPHPPPPPPAVSLRRRRRRRPRENNRRGRLKQRERETSSGCRRHTNTQSGTGCSA